MNIYIENFEYCRTVLKSHQVRDDSSGNVYVSGVTQVEVQSADEALRVLSRGQKARRIASTVLNTDSSRSHVVFNIRLVKVPFDETGSTIVRDNDIIRVSQLSLIDLAGSERTKRTDNQGDRLREASMYFTFCFDAYLCFFYVYIFN